MAWVGTLLACMLVGSALGDSHLKKAICNVSPAASTTAQQISGQVMLSQNMDGTGETTIEVSLSGFTGTDGQKHGFHVHKTGTLAGGCADAGGHYNPENVVHGGPTADVRHVGDMGNVEEDGNGKVMKTFTDPIITLSGDRSVIDRAIVIHAGEDDLNLGTADDSPKTGNAGARLACCIIEESIVATCDIDADSGNEVPVTGTVRLSQKSDGTGPTTLKLDLSGFQDELDNQDHGFHVHMTGATGDSCKDAAGHYNPFSLNHGAPEDTTRHVGDLGNIVVSGNAVETTIVDSMVKLSGDNSVMGRAIVVHAGRDDLGKGGDDESLVTGNAGARLGCCVIKSDDSGGNTASLNTLTAPLLLLVFLASCLLSL